MRTFLRTTLAIGAGVFFTGSLFVVAEPPVTPPESKMDQIEFDRQAMAKIRSFAIELKTRLKTGIQDGGPTKAIAVCHEEAEKIAAKHSEQGWLVRRVSDRPRNPNNAAQGWEGKMLTDLKKNYDVGSEKKYLSEQVGNEFRLMKSIAIDAVCLTCHGENIQGELKDKLDALYPNDLARGYKMEDFRGAFSVTYTAE
ncbi:DUF3365 domain-containing protein [Teredinibacter sp. KSP-S5-2]|uniref:Tll0287-like domain-containing protein n=1 Tax=Teredinibacter sp. KSP-S5-2 TaxID=3034506 RepID=UPI002934F7CC|nr:DUF3365 domain-containing protein [Teredinibacter sp. KSP-S5-2]WNO10775.1 DUF3365 domain-containing protein [Teredinibacter sp. KSP-S5-2]